MPVPVNTEGNNFETASVFVVLYVRIDDRRRKYMVRSKCYGNEVATKFKKLESLPRADCITPLELS